MTPATAPATTTIDVRTIPPRERHRLIFATYDALQPGQSLQLVNDHDPRPLRYQFEDRSYAQFDWHYLEAGPALWRVQISKLRATPAQPAGDACCSGGACCG